MRYLISCLEREVGYPILYRFQSWFLANCFFKCIFEELFWRSPSWKRHFGAAIFENIILEKLVSGKTIVEIFSRFCNKKNIFCERLGRSEAVHAEGSGRRISARLLYHAYCILGSPMSVMHDIFRSLRCHGHTPRQSIFPQYNACENWRIARWLWPNFPTNICFNFLTAIVTLLRHQRELCQ